jgi:hypothetical protein
VKYRKKPVVIEAMQFNGDYSPIEQWVHDLDLEQDPDIYQLAGDEALYVGTLEGEMTAKVGDWIICGVKGEFYPCKPDIFEATYEPVADKEAG